jgi:predicted phosphohydrolase
MKNIHLIPTDKPSRLMIDTIENKLYLQPILHEKTANVLPQNIYITSDEEINLNDYITDGYRVWKWKDDSSLLGRKKIILTTDQELIKDGIQPIDDEFLEWFVNNPSCEEVDFVFNNRGITGTEKILKTFGEYEIIIPKEEAKQIQQMEDRIMGLNVDTGYRVQETLKEAAEKYCLINNIPTTQMIVKTNRSCEFETPVTMFLEGAKYQAERMYSEKEVIAIVEKSRETGLTAEFLILTEQFKKK